MLSGEDDHLDNATIKQIKRDAGFEADVQADAEDDGGFEEEDPDGSSRSSFDENQSLNEER